LINGRVEFVCKYYWNTFGYGHPLHEVIEGQLVQSGTSERTASFSRKVTSAFTDSGTCLQR
jgi:hypothetical protein